MPARFHTTNPWKTLPFTSLLFLVACGSSTPPQTSTTTTECKDLPPLEQKATYKVGLANVWEPGNSWRSTNTQSFQDEATKRGDDLIWEAGVTPVDATEEAQRMQKLIDEKVDAIFVAPQDPTVLAPTVVAARKACIPVFIEDRAIDTEIAIPGADYVSYLGSDFVKEGQLAAQWLVTKTGGTATIIELEGTVGSSAAVGRKQGFDAEIATHPGMSIVVSQSGDFNRVKGHDLTKTLVPQYPDATVIYAQNDEMALGTIQALDELGIVPGTDILIVSTDGEKEAIQAVLDGKIGVVVECNPKFGPLAFSTLDQYASGAAIPQKLTNTDRVFDITTAAAYLPEAF